MAPTPFEMGTRVIFKGQPEHVFRVQRDVTAVYFGCQRVDLEATGGAIESVPIELLELAPLKPSSGQLYIDSASAKMIFITTVVSNKVMYVVEGATLAKTVTLSEWYDFRHQNVYNPKEITTSG